MSKTAIAHELLDQLTAMAEQSSQVAVADHLGVSVSYLGDVLHGRRPISAALARRLGWERMVVFVREE